VVAHGGSSFHTALSWMSASYIQTGIAIDGDWIEVIVTESSFWNFEVMRRRFGVVKRVISC
jgi:hypothetical protein